MTRTFVDSSVLIATMRDRSPVVERADLVLNDESRTFLSSDFVRLEVVPKAIFHRREAELTFYEQFFASIQLHNHARVTAELVADAMTLAARWNLNAVDALHVAAAVRLHADELVTTERPSSTLAQVRIDGLRVTSIR